VKELRDEVERYANRVVAEIDGNFSVRAFTTSNQRAEVIRCVDRHRTWLRMTEPAKVTSGQVYASHLKELKTCVGPVYRRINDNITFWRNLEILFNKTKTARQTVVKYKTMGSPEEKSGAQILSKRIDKIMEWLNESVLINANTSVGEPLKIRPQAVMDKITELKHDVAELKSIGHKPGINVPIGDGDTDQEWKTMSGVDVFDQMYGIPSDDDQEEKYDRGDLDDDL
jgi:hypothetical protein